MGEIGGNAFFVHTWQEAALCVQMALNKAKIVKYIIKNKGVSIKPVQCRFN